MYLHTCRVGNKLSQVWNPRRLESNVTSCPRSSISIPSFTYMSCPNQLDMSDNYYNQVFRSNMMHCDMKRGT